MNGIDDRVGCGGVRLVGAHARHQERHPLRVVYQVSLQCVFQRPSAGFGVDAAHKLWRPLTPSHAPFPHLHGLRLRNRQYRTVRARVCDLDIEPLSGTVPVSAVDGVVHAATARVRGDWHLPALVAPWARHGLGHVLGRRLVQRLRLGPCQLRNRHQLGVAIGS